MENNTQQGKLLYRSNTNRFVFGVCGGLGEYFDIDPILFRIIFILLICAGGFGLLFYLILAFLIPKNPSSTPPLNNPNHVDVKERVRGLAQELKDIKKQNNIKL